LLLMLLVCVCVLVCSSLKSVLKYKFLIWDSYYLVTLYLRQQGYEDPWLLFEAASGSASKNVWETLG
jgi:hypothetical protein